MRIKVMMPILFAIVSLVLCACDSHNMRTEVSSLTDNTVRDITDGSEIPEPDSGISSDISNEIVDEIVLLQSFYDDFTTNGTYENLREMVETHGLYLDHRRNGVGGDYYKIACTKELAKVISNSDLNTPGNYIVIKFKLLQENDIESITFHKDIDDIKPVGDYYNESLNGRGHADSGREEPDYKNVIGYICVSPSQSYSIEKTDDFQNEGLWIVPTYEKDKQFWNQIGTLPHKTEVVVREQILEHEGYGSYSGYLLVEKTDDGSQYYINVNNFITKPYWTYQADIRSAALVGDFIARYEQVSDYYPVDSGGNKLSIPDGTIILVTGVSETSSKINSQETGIEAIVWKDWKKGYGGVKCHFNSNDLTIIY